MVDNNIALRRPESASRRTPPRPTPRVSAFGQSISSRITTVIHVIMTIEQTITVLMSHSFFCRITAYTETCMA